MMKKKREFPNTYVIIFAIMLLCAVATWFVPGGEYSTVGEELVYTEVESVCAEDEIKDKVIQYSKCDPRSINDVLTELFTTTMRYDNETGQQIALFSDEELCGGWKHFRGKNDIPMEKWKLPKNFLDWIFVTKHAKGE